MKLTGQKNQCPTCGEYFASNYAFDKHRVGRVPHKKCMTLSDMREAGWNKTEGFWRTKPAAESVYE